MSEMAECVPKFHLLTYTNDTSEPLIKQWNIIETSVKSLHFLPICLLAPIISLSVYNTNMYKQNGENMAGKLILLIKIKCYGLVDNSTLTNLVKFSKLVLEKRKRSIIVTSGLRLSLVTLWGIDRLL